MITLVLGGTASGKSEFAENLAMKESGKKIYLATMELNGEESKKRIARHKKMRKDKGFLTVEKTKNLGELQVKSEVILLECLGNLVANEMFQGSPTEDIRKKILEDILILEKQSHSLIIVSNNIFCNGANYERETVNYMKCLGNLNCILTEKAQRTIELVYGIPVEIG